jgi:DNA-binding CsgD family transcriptional regulator
VVRRVSIETVTLGHRVPSLARWGFTPDADLVYRTLVTFGPATARGLAATLGLPRRRVADALGALGQAGAAREHVAARGQPTWTARDMASVMAEFERASHLGHRPIRVTAPRSVSECVDQVLAGVHQLGPDLRHLSTRAVTRQRLAALVTTARHEHLTINPETSFDATSAAAAAPLDNALVQRGVSVRVLGVQAPDPSALGFQYRQAVEVPMKLIVIDRQVALFPVEPLDYEQGYLEVTQAQVVEALVASFEKHWATAQDPWENAMPTVSLTAREQALIGLLVAGHTDATAALELRISERSATTIMRSLMDRVGVANRFQLGVALGTLRAAPSPPGLTTTQPPTPCSVAGEISAAEDES